MRPIEGRFVLASRRRLIANGQYGALYLAVTAGDPT